MCTCAICKDQVGNGVTKSCVFMHFTPLNKVPYVKMRMVTGLQYCCVFCTPPHVQSAICEGQAGYGVTVLLCSYALPHIQSVICEDQVGYGVTILLCFGIRASEKQSLSLSIISRRKHRIPSDLRS